MHALPAPRGDEVDDTVMDGPKVRWCTTGRKTVHGPAALLTWFAFLNVRLIRSQLMKGFAPAKLWTGGKSAVCLDYSCSI